MNATLDRHALLEADPMLDGLVRCAATVAECPMSVVGLAQDGQLWFKARQGVAFDRLPMDLTFCRYTMAGTGLFEVPDTHACAEFDGHPLVAGEMGLRYYAGVPLCLEGRALGTLCVGDTCPHQLGAGQRSALQELAGMATQWLRSRRVLARCLGQLGHEMRTPLNAVMGFSRLLLGTCDGTLPSREREWLQHMERGGRHLQALLEDMLQFSRLELDTAPLPVQALPLRPVVEQVLGLLQPLAQQSAVVLHHLFFDEDAWVVANERALRQVLMNLVSNAIKYNRRHGVARVGVKWQADVWELNVIDDGEGLSPEQVWRLFQPFSRVGTDRAVPGSGLGLCISRTLAERMGGSLDVRSTPGAGSVFTLRLPRAAV